MAEYRSLRFLVPRRLVQVGVLLVLAGGNLWGWSLAGGNLSHSLVLDTVPLADPWALLQMLAAGARPAGQALVGGGLVLLFYAVVAGRAFCAWVCPVNPVSDLANRLGRLPVLAPLRRGPRLPRGTRSAVLVTALVLSAVLGVPAFEAVSPIGILQRGVVAGPGPLLAAAALVAVGLFLFDLILQPNGFCGRLCPLGAFYAAAARFSLVRVRHDHRACTGCNECLKVCPEPAILALVGQASGSVLDGVCTNCGRCLEVCRDDALHFAGRTSAMSLNSGGS